MDWKKRILVVDDDENIMDVLSFVLEKAGYEVKLARDGEEGLEIYTNYKPHLILLDLKMPKGGGLTLLHRIRLEDKKTPILVMTGFATLDSSIEAFKTGITDFITKPFHLDRMLEAIDRTLGGDARTEWKPSFQKDVSRDCDPVTGGGLADHYRIALTKAGSLVNSKLSEVEHALAGYKDLRNGDMENIIKIRRNVNGARKILDRLCQYVESDPPPREPLDLSTL